MKRSDEDNQHFEYLHGPGAKHHNLNWLNWSSVFLKRVVLKVVAVCALKTGLWTCSTILFVLMVEPFNELELTWDERQGNILKDQKRHEEG